MAVHMHLGMHSMKETALNSVHRGIMTSLFCNICDICSSNPNGGGAGGSAATRSRIAPEQLMVIWLHCV